MICFNLSGQKVKFFIEDFFSKCDQIRWKLRIWWHLLKKYLMENFIFCAVPEDASFSIRKKVVQIIFRGNYFRIRVNFKIHLTSWKKTQEIKTRELSLNTYTQLIFLVGEEGKPSCWCKYNKWTIVCFCK